MALSDFIQLVNPLTAFVIGMVIYAIFVFKFYKFIARKDIFQFNLTQYARGKNKGVKKFFYVFLYIIEHVFIFPFIATFWLVSLAFFLILVSKGRTVQDILLVSVALVSSVRITAYYDEGLSQDLAKMLPFALLGIFLVDVTGFNFSSSLNVASELPSIYLTIFYYLVFVVILEVVLRITYAVLSRILPKQRKDLS